MASRSIEDTSTADATVATTNALSPATNVMNTTTTAATSTTDAMTTAIETHLQSHVENTHVKKSHLCTSTCERRFYGDGPQNSLSTKT